MIKVGILELQRLKDGVSVCVCVGGATDISFCFYYLIRKNSPPVPSSLTMSRRLKSTLRCVFLFFTIPN